MTDDLIRRYIDGDETVEDEALLRHVVERFPQRLFHLRDLALKAGLDHPLARALAVYGRMQIPRGKMLGGDWVPYRTTEIAEVETMRHVRTSTALKWLRHVANGGALKSIKRTHEEEQERLRQKRLENRDRDEARLPDGERFRKQVRRIRRAARGETAELLPA